MKRFVICCVAAVLFVPGMTVNRAVAQTDMSAFPLTKAIPADVFIAIAARANPEREFLDQYWGEVTKAFMDSGILTDVWDLITDAVPDEQIDEVEDIADRFGGLCKKVNWGGLFQKEMVFAQRFHSSTPGTIYPEGLVMGRIDKKNAAANYAALKSILKETAKLIETKAGEGTVSVKEVKRNGLTIATLTSPDAPPGIGVHVAVWNDIIVFGFGGSGMIDESIALLKGSAKKPGLVATPRFKNAFAQLPPAEDELVFWDIQRMFGTIQDIVSLINKGMASHNAAVQGSGHGAQSEGQEAQPAPEDQAAGWLKLVTTVLSDISMFDSMASVTWTDGYRVFSDNVVSLRNGAKSSPLYKIISDKRRLRHFERFIPKEAETFVVSAGIDPTRLYDYLVHLVKDEFPGGKGLLSQFEQMQKEWKLDIRNDVLSLFEGTSATAGMGKDWIFMIKVTDEKKTDAQVERLIDTINGALGQQNALMITQVQVAEGVSFKQLSHPMMMMMPGMSPPVLGCAEGRFMVASSARVVRKCLRTAAGDHPNITKSKRWKAEALAPKGRVTSISFADETKKSEEWQAGIAGASMAMGMAGMFATNAPPQAQKIFTAIPPILAKLGPVVGKMDFYRSSAAYETFDGHKWYGHTVQNYKKPSERHPDEVKEARAQ